MIATAHKSPSDNMALSQLLTNRILDKRLLAAMHDVPRASFVPERLRDSAYVDEDLEVAPGRGLIAPLTLAQLLAMAEITPDCRALVVGGLNGYTAAVVAKLTAQVVAIELDAGMIEQAREQLKRLGITNVDCRHVSSLATGYKLGAPYDVIVIPGAVQDLPESISEQLAIGGRLVTVRNETVRPGVKLGLGKGLLVKNLDGELQWREHFDASATLLPGFEREIGFAF